MRFLLLTDRFMRANLKATRMTASMPGMLQVLALVAIWPRAQLLKKSAWLLHQIGCKAQPTARNSNENSQIQSCYLHLTGSIGISAVVNFWLYDCPSRMKPYAVRCYFLEAILKLLQEWLRSWPSLRSCNVIYLVANVSHNIILID